MIIRRDVRSPNYNDRPDNLNPDMVILHYTGMKTAAAALERLCDPAAEVSAHYFIDEDGCLYELVDPQKRAWHAGVSHWAGRDNINHYAVGIELVNPGHEFGYQPFPEAQIEALVALLDMLQHRFWFKPSAYVGHSDIAPDRKNDPGEYFPWALLSQSNFGIWSDKNGADTQIAEGADDPAVILDMQRCLMRIGYGIETNGLWGGQTKACVTAFQRHWRPDCVSGLYDKGTRTILYDIIEQIEKQG